MSEWLWYGALSVVVTVLSGIWGTLFWLSVH